MREFGLGTLVVLVAIFVVATDSHSANDLFSAAEQGNLQAVRTLLETTPQLISAKDGGGYTALHKAAYNGRDTVVGFLIQQGAEVNARSNGGSTAMHGAAVGGYRETVQLLVDANADIDIVNNAGYTPLLSACSAGKVEVVRILIAHGASVSARSEDGRTPLMLAIGSGNPELVTLLLDSNCDVNGATADGSNPLRMAIYAANKEMVQLLATRGADVDLIGPDRLTPLFLAVATRDSSISNRLIDRGKVFDLKDDRQFTMLHYAAALGYLDQVKKILSHGVDINAQAIDGSTALDYARRWRHDDVVDYLKRNGAKDDSRQNTSIEGEYFGQKRPGTQPEVFAEDILLTPFAPHGSIAFSPGGREVFWCHHAMPIQAMWRMAYENDTWSRPELASFTNPATEYWDGGPCFDSSGNRLFFYSHRPREAGTARRADMDIWFVTNQNGQWGDPVNLGTPINTDSNEFDPSVGRDGSLFFVGAGREGGLGMADIYVSELVNGQYTLPANLGPAINSPAHELSPAIAPDGSYLVFASSGPGRPQGMNLFVSFRDRQGAWTKAVAFGRSISDGRAWRPSITPDGKSIIYLHGDTYCWFSTKAVEDLRQAMVPFVPPRGFEVSLSKSIQDFGPAETRVVKLADLDSDGDLDAVFSSGQVWLNDGRGQFVRKYENLTWHGHGVDVGDVDSDGDIDIVFASSVNELYLNDGKAGLARSAQVVADSGKYCFNVLLSDLDTDGDLDITSFYSNDSTVTRLNDGRGHFVPSEIVVPSLNAGDLDRDGDTDFFVRKEGVGCKVMLNNGKGVFSEFWSQPDTTLSSGFIGFGDLDKDGDLDVIITEGGNDDIYPTRVMLNDGTGRFKIAQTNLPPTRWGNVAVGDLNGDNSPDVLITNFGLPNYVLLNDGRGKLVDSGLRLGGTAGNMVSSVGDLDGDGDLDAFISTFELGSCEVWFNQD